MDKQLCPNCFGVVSVAKQMNVNPASAASAVPTSSWKFNGTFRLNSLKTST